MSDYQQSLMLEANPAAVYAALTTPVGLQQFTDTGRGTPHELAAAAAA